MDEPIPLPAADREIDDAIETAFAQTANQTMPAARGGMFSFDHGKTDVEITGGDSVARIERKLDAVISSITALKARVDSIDTTLARLIHRG